MKHYIISGGDGFLGSNLGLKLVSWGHNATVIDNLLTGRKDNLAPILNRKHFTLPVEEGLQKPIDWFRKMGNQE